MKSAVILAYSTLAIATTLPRASKIYGGNETAIEDVPWQAQFLRYHQFYCGGSIISSQYIITAAHCTDEISAGNTSIRVGSATRNGGEQYDVVEIHQHPSWVLVGVPDYDISILKLASNLTFTDKVKAIGLVDTTPADDATALISGWGKTENENFPQALRSTTLPILAKDKCQKYQSAYGGTVTDRNICTLQPGGGRSTCNGDSGGPVVVGSKLAGVVSGGYKCGGASEPNTHTSIGNADVRAWIRDYTGI